MTYQTDFGILLDLLDGKVQEVKRDHEMFLP